VKFGDFEIHRVSDGVGWFDGGAIFGVVPKPLWSRVAMADDRNRVAIGLDSMLVRDGSCNILVDAGMGWEWPPKTREIYGLSNDVNLIDSLAALGLSPQDIDVVVLTHLHIDHCGWCVSEGKPVFAKARHVVQRQEWQDATNPHPSRAGSYLPHQFMALEEHGVLELVEGDVEIVSGVHARQIAGHTLGYQTVVVESGGETLYFLGETIPTRHHMKPMYLMAYDLYPVDVVECKVDLVARGIEEEWLFFFQHDPEITFARFDADGDGAIAVSVDG